MTSSIFKLRYISLLILPSLVYSQDKFCYRDDVGNLDCRDNLEEVPTQYKNKAFFKPAIKNNAVREIQNREIPNRIMPNREIQLEENRNKPSKPPEAILPTTPQELEDSNQLPKAKEFNSVKSSKSPKIQVFIAKWCGYCKALEKFLKKRNVNYERYDVEEDPYGMKIYSQHNTVPITLINNNIVVGFEEKKFEEILDATEPY